MSKSMVNVASETFTVYYRPQRNQLYLCGREEEFQVRMEGTSSQGVMLGGFKGIMETSVDCLVFLPAFLL